MCIEVDYHCICGLYARTERMACGFSLMDPLDPTHEQTHQLHKVNLALPRDEWDARQGLCPQEGCAQNDELPGEGEGEGLLKCPGCSTLIGEDQPTPETIINGAKFLDRALWDSHECEVAFCPFNTPSMNRANQNFTAFVDRMQREPEPSEAVWNPAEDERILDLAGLGADEELIANMVSRSVAEVQDRLDYLRLLKEVFG
ncbi:hypothetical protein N8I77_007694 [Diaporthe amygdali]|uniref:Uncharacterized protein n=1 Tax=Phomopsis amygdali TaxID=1214568 RepID=A0AAD9W269_PHOAM|nr:hypothetical protein N8I77_007694 [Diaporthe amygdali]